MKKTGRDSIAKNGVVYNNDIKFNKMNMIFVVVLLLKIFCLVAERYFPGNLSTSFGCLEKTNVTVLVAETTIKWPKNGVFDQIERLLGDLRDPCYTLYVFVHNSRQFIKWDKNIRNQFEAQTQGNHMGDTEVIEFIKNLQQQQQQQQQQQSQCTDKQILLIFFQFGKISSSSIEVIREIEILDNETNWNVIIVCRYAFCPIKSNRIPLHRIVSDSFELDGVRKNRIIDLVRNPDFNRYKYLEHRQRINNSKKLDCLENKTINIYMNNINHKTFDDIALLINEIKGFSTRIVLYQFEAQKEFWIDFLGKIQINFIYFKMLRIVELQIPILSFGVIFNFIEGLIPLKSDHIYLFDGRHFDGIYRHSLCFNLKATLGYPKRLGIEDHNWDTECRDRFVFNPEEGFVDGVFKDSCPEQ